MSPVALISMSLSSLFVRDKKSIILKLPPTSTLKLPFAISTFWILKSFACACSILRSPPIPL